MQSLLALVSGFFSSVRAFVGLFLPIFSNAADFRSWPGWVRVLIGFGIVAAICVGLFFLQRDVLHLDEFLDRAPRAIQQFVLPMLFLLVVLFSWIAYGLWLLFARGSEAAEFPDIQAAWAEAIHRLNASGLRVGDAPLFLVLGMPAARLDALFLAAGVKGIIRTPGQGETPIRVYAWDEAIFVTCPGASAWGKFCLEVSDPSAEPQWGGEGGGGANKTIGAGGFSFGLDPLLEAELKELVRVSQQRDLTTQEADRLRELSDLMNTSAAAPRRKVSIPEDERVRQTRRLRYLCELIRQERQPWCPVNGVLVLVPWEATESDELARVGCGVLDAELRTAREVFQQRYPTFALVCDLEAARGFDQFRSGFRADMLKQRIGQRVPLVPVGEPEEVGALVGSAARWIGLSVLPAWILRFLKLDAGPDTRQTPGASLAHNRNLYLLMRAVFERGPRLAELLARGVPPVGGHDEYAPVPMFGGIYLAATGRDGKQQAFVEGVFQRVIESQNAVSWSPQALAEDYRRRRMATVGYVVVALLTVAVVGACYWLVTR
ncbi:MAG TPA: type VI secretion protein IcmF/TssM N-terminal domain-containing protein [Fimbriiglobus sp.]|nr:type VI secretion protein IcmF/TssM N-terminal domain-containing protein [Fimbriiglobus sp.]